MAANISSCVLSTHHHCDQNSNNSLLSLSNAAGSLICVGSDLFARGYDDEAMAMFDVAYSVLQRQQQSCTAGILPQAYYAMVSKHLQMGAEILQQDKGTPLTAQRTQAALIASHSVPSVAQIEEDSQDRCDVSYAEEAEPADLYQEDECDVGPRVLKTAVKLSSSCCYIHNSSDLMEAIVLFNKGLVCHSKGRLSEAKQMYELVIFTVQKMLSTVSSDAVEFLGVPFMELSMRAHNNLGLLCYHERRERQASSCFERAIQFAQRLATVHQQQMSDESDGSCARNSKSAKFISYQIEYATALSNWCRVHWMRGDISDHLYAGVKEVLAVRSALLPWDHPDVAAAHYNVAVAEYARQESAQAVSHLMQYLAIASHRNQRSNKLRQADCNVNDHYTAAGDLDAIPALIFLLLIQNEDKDDHMSQELLRGLRTLQDKRQDQGPQSSEVASVLNFVGTLLFHKNDFESALIFFQEELRLEDNSNSSSNIITSEDDEDGSCFSVTTDETSVSVTCNNIGRILQELGRYPEAIHFYQRALKAEYGDVSQFCSKAASKPSTASPNAASSASVPHNVTSVNLYSTVWYNLGLIHDKLRSYEEAIFAFEMSLELRKAMLGPDHADIACLLYNIGVLQMEQQRLSDASSSFKEALRIRRAGAAGQLNDRHVVKTLEKLASLHKAKGNCAGAIEATHEILEIQQMSDEFDGVKRLHEMGMTLRSVAELYHAQGDLDSAVTNAKDSVNKLQTAAIMHKKQLLEEFAKEGNDSRTVAHQFLLMEQMVCDVEQIVSSLLLLGSLYHEMAEPLLAFAVLREAAEIVEQPKQQNSAVQTSSLNALREVTLMLARCHCAPEA